MEKLLIRNETESDRSAVEEITRDAFWNLNAPGCDEHYLAHIMREHEDFIPELNLVAELNGSVVGSIMYTKAKLINEAGESKSVLTFGPLCIRPDCQRKGYGKALMERSFETAKELGFGAIVIFGNPRNYVGRGFKSCKRYGVSLGGIYPAALLVKELIPGFLGEGKWVYQGSSVYEFDAADAQRYDERFEKREKGFSPSQEEFYIHSHSTVQ